MRLPGTLLKRTSRGIIEGVEGFLFKITANREWRSLGPSDFDPSAAEPVGFAPCHVAVA
jgi:hypothetical protein